jgi:nucleoside phosphorylase
MADEMRIAKAIAGPDVLVLSGVMTASDLQKAVPLTCRAILNSGLCGGLAPGINVGDIVIATKLYPSERVMDAAWSARLCKATGGKLVPWFATDQWNLANTPAQRAALFAGPGRPEVIDDEFAAVAEFAEERKIACASMRSVSDAWDDTVPPVATVALRQNGTFNFQAVWDSVDHDPKQLPTVLRMMEYYGKSLGTLHTAATQVGAMFQWQ